MADKTTKLIRSEQIAEGTSAFHLERPLGFDYEAGQTIDLTLIDPTDMDAEGPVRTFSLVSAPHEKDLMFATRMRDTAFKRTIAAAKAGLEISWDGPYGSFTLHKNASKPAVFLAGGIGITPFMSIIKDAVHKNLPHEMYLFHSNNRPEDSPFFGEVTTIDHSTPNFHFIPTMTTMEKSSQKWNGETGFITAEMIQKQIGDLSKPIYYLAGPPGFVSAMRTMLKNAGADEDNIKFEEFPGY
jgi:ferredoxin-NADP reductase